MKNIEIRRWDNGEVIVCGKYESVKDCLEKNINANLRFADLRFANLSESNLSGSNLRESNLSGSDLSWSNLSGSNLSESNLSESNLSESNLSGSNLSESDLRGSDLRESNLSGSNLSESDLSWSDLRGSNLSGSNLRESNLSGSDLSWSNLSGSNLSGSNLSSIKYKEPLFLPDLYSIKILPKTTKLIYWKYLTNGKTPYQNATYEVGKIYRFDNCNSNESESCGEGGNIATLTWCLKDNLMANEFLQVEFQVKDIVAIPYATDGKFRVKKFKVLKQFTRKEVLKLLNNAMKKETK